MGDHVGYSEIEGGRIKASHWRGDSGATAEAKGEKFYCEYKLIFELPGGGGNEQFGDVVDAKDRDINAFKQGLKNSLLKAVKDASGTSAEISIENLATDFEMGDTKFNVEISFELTSFIASSGGATTYDLSWRDFKATKKVEVDPVSPIDPSEAMALNFEKFSASMKDWEKVEADGKTSFKIVKEYDIKVDVDEIYLKTTYSIIIPQTGLTVNVENVVAGGTAAGGQGGTGTLIMIPGFPWEGLVAGLLIGLMLLTSRRKVVGRYCRLLL